MSAISELPPPVAWTVAQPWLGARSAADAARELLTFAESADGSQRVASLTFAGELGSDATDAWREWAKRPGIGAYPRQWLRSWARSARGSGDEAWLAVNALGVTLDALADTLPPFLLQATLAQQFGEEVTEVAEQMLRSGHPRAQDIAALLTGRSSGDRVGAPVRHARAPAQDHAARGIGTASVAARPRPGRRHARRPARGYPAGHGLGRLSHAPVQRGRAGVWLARTRILGMPAIETFSCRRFSPARETGFATPMTSATTGSTTSS